MKIVTVVLIVFFSSISCWEDSSEDTDQDSDEYTGGDRIDIGTDTLYSIERKEATWDEASENCQSKGTNGRLASIDSDYTSRKLGTYVKNVGHQLWIGIQKGPSGTITRTGNAQSSYLNWDSGEPNDLGIEDCLEILSWSMKWNDLRCDKKRFYLCAYDKVETSSSSADVPGNSMSSMPKPSPTLTDSSEDTDQDSDEYTGADRIDIGTDTLYSIERKEATWDEASEKCKSKGINGRLASIDSSYTSKKLEEYVKNVGRMLWIGIRKGPSGTLIRTENAQSRYINWDKGEPNDLGTEDCLEVLNWSMKWNDLHCDKRRFYLCAYDKELSLSNDSLTSVETSSSPAALPGNSMSFMSEPSFTLTDIARESHANLIATSFLIVFVFIVCLAALVLKRWPITPKVVFSDTEALL